MPVDAKKPSVAELESSWQIVRDCVAGPRVVKAKGDVYLPRLKAHQKTPTVGTAATAMPAVAGQPMSVAVKPDSSKYGRYLDRAVFNPVTRRTKLGFEGLVFDREVEVEVPDEKMLADVTLTGVNFQAFARRIFGEVVSPGRVTIMVDMAAEQPGVANRARAYQRRYAAEHLLWWREETVEALRARLRGVDSPNFQSLGIGEGATVKSHVRLYETVEEPDPKDPWQTVCVPQVRVIDLRDVADKEGNVTVGQVHQLYRKVKSDDGQEKWMEHGAPIVPKRSGDPVPFIPVETGNPESVGPEPEEPPLLGMALINLSQYKTSADLENARFKLGHPQLYLFGVSDTEKGVEIGDGLWLSANENAKTGSVQVQDEFGGLERAMVEKREQMSDEGARIMAKREVQRTATEAEIDRAGERSLLATMADSVSELLQRCLAWQVWWNDGVDTLPEVQAKVSVKLNKDFDNRRMSSADALSLMQVWQGGPLGPGMSRSAYVYNQQRGGLLPPGRTAEEEEALLELENARGGFIEDNAGRDEVVQ